MTFDAALLERIVQNAAPGSRLLRTWPLTGGISAQMTALEVEGTDGQVSKLIVRQPGDATLKQNPHAAMHEFKLLQIIQGLGLATPRPYYLDESSQLLARPYLIIEYIEGAPQFAPNPIADCSRQLAEQLAQIHRIKRALADLPFLPHSPTARNERLGRWSIQTHPSLNESLHEGRIRAVLQAIWPLPQCNTDSLLHGDFWPGNVLWRDGQLVAVIDWEDAHWGDPLSDFAISRLDMLWIFGLEAFQVFTNHYQSILALDYTDLPYWDLCAALRLVRLAGANLAEWAAFFAPLGRPDITEQTIRAHYQFFSAQAFEKLALR